MSLTREKLGRLPEAAVDYERFLEVASGGRYPRRARAVKSLLAKLRLRVPRWWPPRPAATTACPAESSASTV